MADTELSCDLCKSKPPSNNVSLAMALGPSVRSETTWATCDDCTALVRADVASCEAARECEEPEEAEGATIEILTWDEAGEPEFPGEAWELCAEHWNQIMRRADPR